METVETEKVSETKDVHEDLGRSEQPSRKAWRTV